MVVTFLPATPDRGVTQERRGTPSRCTVQAPHCASPQPKCGLLWPRSLRMAYSRGMFGSPSTETAWPSSVNSTVATEGISVREVPQVWPSASQAESLGVLLGQSAVPAREGGVRGRHAPKPPPVLARDASRPLARHAVY